MKYSSMDYTWIILLTLWSCLAKAENIAGDIQIYHQQCNAEISTNSPNRVYPVIVSNSDDGVLQPLPSLNITSQHPDELTLKILFNKNVHTLSLTYNGQLISTSSTQFNRFTKALNSQYVDNSYYVGYCVSEGHMQTDNFVALSVTPTALRGVIKINSLMYNVKISPTTSDKKMNSSCIPHIMELANSNLTTHKHSYDERQWQSFENLHQREYLSILHTTREIQRNVVSKKIKLALVFDFEMARYFSYTVERAEEYALLLTNIIDLIYQRVNIRVSLVHYEVWYNGDQFTITNNPRENIQNFLKYTQKNMRTRADVIQLITGVEMLSLIHNSTTTGYTIPDSICTSRSRAILSVKQIEDNSQLVASLVSHMIGHIIGLKTDTDDCECTGGSCIMSQDSGAFTFSRCSFDRLKLLGRVKMGVCLTDELMVDPYLQFCGNGVLERGEQCDCGLRQECDDPCCDATTCLLKSWAVCREGQCCENCLPRNATHLCRPAVGECDAAEYCDQSSGLCPVDDLIQDGESCANNSAYCYHGECRTKTSQCHKLWGDKSETSISQCYSLNNKLGNLYGHCGEDGSGGHRQCADSDVMCGLLQCQLGAEHPIQPNLGYRKTSARVDNNIEMECKTVNRIDETFDSGIDLVSDGTKCADDFLCMNNKCVPTLVLNVKPCPTSKHSNLTCAGNGRCTASLRCSCNSGWSGDLCESYTPQTIHIVDTTPTIVTDKLVKHSDKLPMILGICAGVVMFIALLIGITAAFRMKCLPSRKKNTQHNRPCDMSLLDNQNLDHLTEIQLNEFGTYARPNYMSYRQKKRRRRRRSSTSSDSDSDDKNLPSVLIYNLPDPSGPSRGILKKPTLAKEPYSSSGSLGSSQDSSMSDNDLNLNTNLQTPTINDDSSIEMKLCLKRGSVYSEATTFSFGQEIGDSGVSTESEHNHQVSPPYIHRDKLISQQTIIPQYNSNCTLTQSPTNHQQPVREPMNQSEPYYSLSHLKETEDNFNIIRSQSMDAKVNQLDSPVCLSRPEQGPVYQYEEGTSANRRLPREMDKVKRARSQSLVM